MIELEDRYVLHLKFLMYCFEWMPDLQINYDKSEVYASGVDKEEQIKVANQLNGKLGSMPMIYLGIQVGDHHLGASVFNPLCTKMAKRLDFQSSRIS